MLVMHLLLKDGVLGLGVLRRRASLEVVALYNLSQPVGGLWSLRLRDAGATGEEMMLRMPASALQYGGRTGMDLRFAPSGPSRSCLLRRASDPPRPCISLNGNLVRWPLAQVARPHYPPRRYRRTPVGCPLSCALN